MPKIRQRTLTKAKGSVFVANALALSVSAVAMSLVGGLSLLAGVLPGINTNTGSSSNNGNTNTATNTNTNSAVSANAIAVSFPQRTGPLQIQNNYRIQYDGTPLILTKESRITVDRALTELQKAENILRAKRMSVQQSILNVVSQIRQVTDLVKLKNGVFDQEFNDLTFSDSANLSATEAEQISKIPGVKKVSPNYIAYALMRQSAPLIGASRLWLEDAMGALCSASGKPCLDGTGIRVAVIDTGVNYTHPGFGSCTQQQFLNGECQKVVGGHDFVTCNAFNTLGQCVTPRDEDNDPVDGMGHGSHVAGIIAGRDTDINGIAPGAEILAYKVLNDSQGMGDSRWIESAMAQAVTDGARVINLSLGSNGDPDDPSSVAVNNLVNAGIVVVVSAGNSGPGSSDASCRHGGTGSANSICSPGTAELAITVGATYKMDYTNYIIGGVDVKPVVDQIAFFSSRGPVQWLRQSVVTRLDKPDIAAPGIVICSARSSNLLGPCNDTSVPIFNNNEYVGSQGTSMAAPMVAGAAAVILQAHPNWTPQQVKQLLMDHAVDNPNQALAVEGRGRMDLYGALHSAIQEPLFVRGDANNDGAVDITDPINILGFLFTGNPVELSCMDAADVNDSGTLNITDGIHLLNFLFNPNSTDGTDKISDPYPGKGSDPTSDDLGCNI